MPGYTLELVAYKHTCTLISWLISYHEQWTPESYDVVLYQGVHITSAWHTKCGLYFMSGLSSAFHSWIFRAAIALLLLLPPASDQISHTPFETQDRDMSKDFASAHDTETFGERKARACRRTYFYFAEAGEPQD